MDLEWRKPSSYGAQVLIICQAFLDYLQKIDETLNLIKDRMEQEFDVGGSVTVEPGVLPLDVVVII